MHLRDLCGNLSKEKKKESKTKRSNLSKLIEIFTWPYTVHERDEADALAQTLE